MPLVLSFPAPAAPGPLAIDLDGIVPDRLLPLSAAAIARLPIRADGRTCELRSCFEISGDVSDGAIECRGDFSRVHRVAAGMLSGSMRVDGSVGRHAAAGMRGGRLDVDGDAGDWLAAELRGGEVHVAGNAGDNVAAALPGSVLGMQGGVAIVAGRAGCLAGARMRRGILAIGGDCGDAAGLEMRAGSVVIGGTVGRHAGLGMQRGSVIALAARPEVPATFRRGAAWRPAFLPFLLRRLQACGFRPPAASPAPAQEWRQWHGDALAGGRGELLHPA
jgi:formylmethanofuran dehydrogenase subunit C